MQGPASLQKVRLCVCVCALASASVCITTVCLSSEGVLTLCVTPAGGWLCFIRVLLSLPVACTHVSLNIHLTAEEAKAEGSKGSKKRGASKAAVVEQESKEEGAGEWDCVE